MRAACMQSWLAAVGLVVAVAASCSRPNPAFEGVGPADANRPASGLADAAAPVPGPGGRRDAAPDVVSSLDARPAPTVACPDDSDLLLCLRFERVVKDESPTALPLTVTSVGFEPGPDGSMAHTTSASSIRNTITAALDVSRLTVEMWVKPASLPLVGERFMLADYQRQWALFVLPGGGLTCRVSLDRWVQVDNLLVPGVWSSVACTVDNTAITLWHNGVARASKPISGFGPVTSGPSGIGVACNVQSGTQPNPDAFVGWIDNVRVWRRVRTADEICRASIGCR